MQDLKVAFIQADLIWENPTENRLRFSAQIDTISKPVDLIILPEMFTTGFTMHPHKVAETMNGETVTWLLQLAENNKCAVTGSLIIKEHEKYYNRLLFVYPSGEIKTYNKRHTFTLAGEDKIYAAGTEKLVVDYKGWKICPLICYDLRFPVWARNTVNYDLLLYVANWPKTRIAAWDTLLNARAIENMCYCIGVNRIGQDANGHRYVGHSAVYDSLGRSIASIEPSKEHIEILTLDRDHIQQTREKLQFLNDRDDFELL